MTSKIVHVTDDHDINSTHDHIIEFKNDIQQGLSKTHKQIPSKYFYDETGSDLFNQITRHPDYYLTQCEIEILTKYKNKLSELLYGTPFNLIELGPGEGIKTSLLLEQFLQDSQKFNYSPIDISSSYLKSIVKGLSKKMPSLKLTAIHSDYFKGLKWLSVTSERRNVVLFLGSSIGNFDTNATEEFLKHVWQILHHGDFFLIGFDLRKEIDTLLRAYNDSDKITQHFNLNLLARINRELGANFSIADFHHYPTYNVYTGAMESYLVSLKPQVVAIPGIEKTFYFEKTEPIHVEYSHKYLLSQMEQFAKNTGFRIIENFTDSREYFVDSLWQVCK